MTNFMDLPREIRDQIYVLLLTVGTEIVAHPTWFEESTNFEAEDVNRPTVALLRVNWQISNEAAAILYGHNTWRIPDLAHLELNIYAKYGDQFRHVTVHLDRRDNDAHFTTRMVEETYERCISLPMLERIRKTHNHRLKKFEQSMSVRGTLVLRHMSRIQSLTIVVYNLYCPSGCCRLKVIKTLYENFLHLFEPEPENAAWDVVCPESLKDVRMTGLKSQAEKDLVYGEWGMKGAAVEQDAA